MRWLVAALILLLSALPAAAAPLIVISIDAFRADYLGRGKTPVLAELGREGARARAMHPSFPTYTYPNHYSLVTGLRPDEHGVVENQMHDAGLSPPDFSPTRENAEDPRWWSGAVPLWATARKAGRVVASAGWPGSQGLIGGLRPDYLDFWRLDRDPQEVAAVALNWLGLPARFRPSLMFLYFDDVDRAGHDYGPDSPGLNAALARVDAALGALVAGLKKRGLYDGTNIVVVSDHGMAPSAKSRAIILDDLSPALGTVLSDGAVAEIEPVPGRDAALAADLLKPHTHFACWRKQDLPARFHYGHNRRVAPFVCLADDGWLLVRRSEFEAWKGGHLGSHGYDPMDPRMDALFLARGPAFRRGVELAPFDNIDVYPLLARVAGLRPEKNDGHLARFAPALR